MARVLRTCPNADCEKHGVPTKLMGGCDCGSKLVPLDDGPTDAQLINLAEIVLGPEAGTFLAMCARAGTLEDYRPGLLSLHRKVQNAARRPAQSGPS